jgi:hypothetical protein
MMAKGKVRVYIAGKITGEDPGDVERKFHAAEVQLRRDGAIPVSPLSLPQGVFSWNAYMHISGAMLDECDAVLFLPDWQDSKGAVREFERAVQRGIAIYFEKPAPAFSLGGGAR